MTKAQGSHEPLTHYRKTKAVSDRKFGFVMAAASGVIGVAPLVRGNEVRTWAIAIALLFGFAALRAPGLLLPLKKAWLKLGIVLQKIASPVAMAVIYFAFLTPMAWLLRVLGKDLLRLRWKDGSPTHWKRPGEGNNPWHRDMKQQF